MTTFAFIKILASISRHRFFLRLMALSPEVNADVPAAPPITTISQGIQQQLVPMMKASTLPKIVLEFINDKNLML